jgi:hypothetical protein
MSIIALFTLVCICIAIYAIWTVQVSRQRTNDLLTELKKTRKSLQDSVQNNIHANSVIKRNADNLPEVELAIKVKAITMCIDSIRHDLVILSKQEGSTPFSYPNMPRLLSLKNNLAGYNSFIQSHFPGKLNIGQADLINVADIPTGSSSIPWENYYFKNTNVLAVITALTFINTQVLKLQQKAIN